MATIAQRITDVWSTTEAELADADAVNYSRAKTSATEETIYILYKTIDATATVPDAATIESTGSVVLQQQIADLTVMELLPLARDMYMQGVLQQNSSASLSGSVGNNLYNKLDALDRLEEMLKERIARREDLIAAELTPVSQNVPPRLPGVSFNSTGRRVLDPNEELVRRWNGC